MNKNLVTIKPKAAQLVAITLVALAYVTMFISSLIVIPYLVSQYLGTDQVSTNSQLSQLSSMSQTTEVLLNAINPSSPLVSDLRLLNPLNQHRAQIQSHNLIQLILKSYVTGAEINQVQAVETSLSRLLLHTYLQPVSAKFFPQKNRLLQQYQHLLAAAKLTQAIIFSHSPTTIAIGLVDNYSPNPQGGSLSLVGLYTFQKGTVIQEDWYSPAQLDEKLHGQVYRQQNRNQFFSMTGIQSTLYSTDETKFIQDLSWYLEKQAHLIPDYILLINTRQVLAPIITSNSAVDLYSPAGIDQLIDELIAYYSQQANLDPLALASTLLAQLRSKDIGIFSQVNQASLVVSQFRGSVLGTIDCPIQPHHCNSQVFYIAESNRGVNQVSLIARKAEHTLTISDHHTQHQHQYIITNQSPDITDAAGKYQAYLHIDIPVASTDIVISIDDIPILSSQWQVELVGELKEVGIPINISSGEQKKVIIDYRVPRDQQHQIQYLTIKKQPGIGQKPLHVSVINDTSKSITWRILPPDWKNGDLHSQDIHLEVAIDP